MKTEWEAWQAVVKKWPGDINDAKFNKLVSALLLWGERLAALRVSQPEHVRAVALARAEDGMVEDNP